MNAEESQNVVNMSAEQWAEAKKIAQDFIVNKNASAPWTINKLVECGFEKSVAESVVESIMVPILKKKAADEAASQDLLWGAAALFGGTGLLIVELMFMPKVHIILFLWPIYGIYRLIKGILGKVKK